MSTMNISLPDDLKSFVDEQVAGRGYTSTSEYLRALIRLDQDKEKLRALLLEGLQSPLSGVVADEAYFADLRAKVRDWSAAKGDRQGKSGKAAKSGSR